MGAGCSSSKAVVVDPIANSEPKGHENPDYWKTRCAKTGTALQHAPDDIRNNKDVVLIAVRQDGNALQFATAEMQQDREVVLAAVTSHGRALEYGGRDYRNDKEIVITAVSQEGSAGAIKFASPVLQADKEVAMAACANDNFGEALQYCSEELRNDREVVLAAVKANSNNFQRASPALKQNDVEIRTLGGIADGESDHEDA